jgi:plastocyanin
MRSTTFFGIIAVLSASATLAGCGSDTTSGTTGTGGAGTGGTGGAGGTSTTSTGDTSTSTSSTSTGSTSSGTSTSSGSSSGTGGPMLVNGCDPTALVDHTKEAAVEIAFGGATGYKYAPPCIKIKSGTTVTFKGDFVTHPLSGGEVVGSTPTADKLSPIKPTTAGASAAFAITPAGSYPYFCTAHYAGGMQGLIVAE